MEFEENEYRRALWAGIIHVMTWVFLCYMRRKYFAVPRLLGMLTFNIFTLSYLYTQAYALCANTLGDPNTKIIWSCFALSDAFFAFAYATLNDYMNPVGFSSFCAFPKFFFALSFYLFFNDRFNLIVQLYLLTSISTYLHGVQCQELLLDCLDEEITEFGALDHYTLMYLDLPYIIRKIC